MLEMLENMIEKDSYVFDINKTLYKIEFIFLSEKKIRRKN